MSLLVREWDTGFWLLGVCFAIFLGLCVGIQGIACEYVDEVWHVVHGMGRSVGTLWVLLRLDR